MKCGGDAPKVAKKPVDPGPIDAATGPRMRPKAELKCLAKYDGYVKRPAADLRSKFRSCRTAALHYLWRTGDVKTLVAALRSDIEHVRDLAFQNLEAIMADKPSRRNVQTLVRELSKVKHNNLLRARIIAALSFHSRVRRNGRLRKKLAVSLRKMLDPKFHELKESKILALESLGRLRAEEALPDILKTLRGNDDVQLRIAAANAVAQIKPTDDKAIQALIEVGNSAERIVAHRMEDEAGMIARETMDNIYREAMSTYIVPDVDSVPRRAVHEAADVLNSDPNVQLYASIIQALGCLGTSTEDATDLIANAMRSPIWNLRKAAAFALTRIDHSEAPALLKQAILSEGKQKAYRNIPRVTERVGVLTIAYRRAVYLADRADRRNVEFYARNFGDKNSSKAERLAWIEDLKELGG